MVPGQPLSEAGVAKFLKNAKPLIPLLERRLWMLLNNLRNTMAFVGFMCHRQD